MKRVIMAGTLVLAIATASYGASMHDLLYQGANGNDMAIFHAKKHAEKGLVCKDCHNKDIFPAKKFGSAKITMKTIAAGKHCGTCHNGVKAFSVTGKCNLCHPQKSADMVVYD